MSKSSADIIYKLIDTSHKTLILERLFYASSDIEALKMIKYPKHGVLLRSNDRGVFYPFIVARFVNRKNIDEVRNV